MNFLKFSSIVVLSTLSILAATGCAATTEESSDATQDEVVSRPRIELATSSDPTSVQARLYKLLETFKGDADLDIGSAIESASLTISGSGEAGVRGRAIFCDFSRMEVVGPGGSGFSQINLFGCVLQGFDKVRNGGVLPTVIVPFEGNQILAGKLFTLLSRGADEGGLGVKKTGGDRPPCCDIPSSVTYTIANADASLSCTMRSGGIAAIQRVECAYLRNDTH